MTGEGGHQEEDKNWRKFPWIGTQIWANRTIVYIVRAYVCEKECVCLDEGRGEEEEGMSMQFLSFPQPPKTKNNATLQ